MLVLLAVAAGAWDLSRPPADQRATAAALWAIHAYQRTISPAIGAAGVTCRFTPTCSRYGEVVIRRHGILKGGWLAMTRIARCGPWTPAGTIDEP